MLAQTQQHTDLEVDNDDEGCVGGHSIRKDAICDSASPGLSQGKQGHKEAHDAMPQALHQPPASFTPRNPTLLPGSAAHVVQQTGCGIHC